MQPPAEDAGPVGGPVWTAGPGASGRAVPAHLQRPDAGGGDRMARVVRGDGAHERAQAGEVVPAALGLEPRPQRVGAARERGALQRALDAARAGHGASVLVAGEAGVGKTRLISELGAHAEGFEVLPGRCLDLVGTELPYQPFAEALGGLPERGASSQLRLFEAILAGLDERAPALLVLEDLHWADASTLDLVVCLAYNVHDRSVLLLGTYRPNEPATAESMRRLPPPAR